MIKFRGISVARANRHSSPSSSYRVARLLREAKPRAWVTRGYALMRVESALTRPSLTRGLLRGITPSRSPRATHAMFCIRQFKKPSRIRIPCPLSSIPKHNPILSVARARAIQKAQARAQQKEYSKRVGLPQFRFFTNIPKDAILVFSDRGEGGYTSFLFIESEKVTKIYFSKKKHYA